MIFISYVEQWCNPACCGSANVVLRLPFSFTNVYLIKDGLPMEWWQHVFGSPLGSLIFLKMKSLIFLRFLWRHAFPFVFGAFSCLALTLQIYIFFIPFGNFFFASTTLPLPLFASCLKPVYFYFRNSRELAYLCKAIFCVASALLVFSKSSDTTR